MKKLSIILLAILLTVSLFVSCDNTTKAVTDERVAVTFSTSAGSRGLNYVIEDVSELNWYYTAQKNSDDTSPFKYGATKTETQITLGSQVEFSQGLWNFTLCARRVNTQSDGTKVVGEKVYQGSSTGVLITKKTSPKPIEINVSPVIAGVNGSIRFDNIYIALKGDSKTKNVYPSTALIVNKDEQTQTIDLEDGSAVVDNLPPGDYKVTVYHTETIGNDTVEYASETLFVTVWSGRETTINGNITELTGSAIIDGNIQIPTIAAISKTATAGQETIFKASVAPVNNLQSTKMESTTVSFEAGALNAGNYNLSVEVTNKVEDGISIGSSNGDVATLILNLKQNNTDTTFSGQATITTYIAKDLTGVTVSYNGTGAAPSDIEYVASTGKLTFKTTHFSTFEVKADIQAEIGSKKYCSLQTAVDVAKENDTITLVSDINLSSSLVINGGKELIINLNGHNISAPSRTIKISNSKLTLTGTGIIYETIDDQIGAIILEGSSDSNASDYSVVTVGENVTLRGWSGIFVSSPSNKNGNNYGVVANVNGKIKLPGVDTHNTKDGAGIYINGQNNNTDGNVPEFKLDGAEITGNAGIYAAGYAKWNFKNVTIEAESEALSIKAGEFVIDGGNYTAKGEFADPSEDTSNGSVETGAALSMTSNSGYAHKIDVTVNSGHFESKNGYSVYEGIPNKKGTSTPVASDSFVTLRINGGEFVGNTEKGAIKLSRIQQPKVITGGTFSSNPSAFVANGHSAVNTINSKWKVVESSVLGKKYTFSDVDEESAFCPDCYNHPETEHSTHNKYLNINNGVAEVKRNGAWMAFTNLDWANKVYSLEYDVDLSELAEGLFVAFDSGETVGWQDIHLGFKKTNGDIEAYNTLFSNQSNDSYKLGFIGDHVHVSYTYDCSGTTLNMSMFITDETNGYSVKKTVNNFDTNAKLYWNVYTPEDESNINIYAKLDNFKFSSISKEIL